MGQVREIMSGEEDLCSGSDMALSKPLVMNGPKSFVWICLNHQRRFVRTCPTPEHVCVRQDGHVRSDSPLMALK